MQLNELNEWLEKKQLLEIVLKNYKVFVPILKKCLKLKDENVVIVGDLGLPDKRVSAIMIGCYAYAVDDLKLDYSITIQSPRFTKMTAGKKVIKALSKMQDSSALILSVSGKLGSLGEIGKSYRRFCKTHNHKFISTPGLSGLETHEFPELIKAINIDYHAMQKKAIKLNEQMTKAKEIRVKTEAGTDITFNVTGKKAISNDGFITKEKLGGNLPAGEVYIPPRGKGVNGRVVVDASCKYNGETALLKKEKITLDIKDGEITKIKGGKIAEKLEENLKKAYKKAKYPWGIYRIGELGIGINPGASVVGPTLINEKAIGTAHVAIGSNYWFGGTIYAIIHLDQVFYDPIIYIDGKKISI